MRPLIDVRDLHFHYEDGTPALQGVSFRLDPGEMVALLGANGSGKSTFVMHLNGLLAGEGSVEVCGMKVEPRHLPAIRKKVGIVFQDSESQLFMPTVLEDVAFGPLNLGLSREQALKCARRALETVAMDSAAARAPYHLSAGEKKRVAIAGILAMNPEILVLDEPTTYLDPPSRHALAELLLQLPQAKIVVTQDIPFAQATCNRAVLFQGGLIVAEGSIEDMVNRSGWDIAWERSKLRR